MKDPQQRTGYIKQSTYHHSQHSHLRQHRTMRSADAGAGDGSRMRQARAESLESRPGGSRRGSFGSLTRDMGGRGTWAHSLTAFLFDVSFYESLQGKIGGVGGWRSSVEFSSWVGVTVFGMAGREEEEKEGKEKRGGRRRRRRQRRKRGERVTERG